MNDTPPPLTLILTEVTSYFFVTSVTYLLVLAMPSILFLTPTAMNFAIIGVMGLATALNSWFFIFLGKLHGSGRTVFETVVIPPALGLVTSILYSIPFFIAIACGTPAFITTSYFSWSAANIAVLTYESLLSLAGIIDFASNACDFSVSSSEFDGGSEFKKFNTFQPQESHGNGYNCLI